MIFRKVAMERLSSPEQLDQLMQVADPRGWLALGALGALLLMALTWGIFGSIPTEAQGEGILLRSGGVASVVAAENGQVEDILVGVGDVIQKGQVVALIRQEELLRQIQDSRTKLATRRAAYQGLLRYSGDQRRLRDQGMAQKRANLLQSIQATEREAEASALARVRFQTARSARGARRPAMGSPIAPSPRKPAFTSQPVARSPRSHPSAGRARGRASAVPGGLRPPS